MKKYKIDSYDIKTEDVFTDNPDNAYITETAGFIPLDVKFKRFEQAGIRAQFNANEFTSQDYRDMYLNPDFSIDANDDLETAQMKLDAQMDYINQLKQSKLGDSEALERSEKAEVIAKSDVPNENIDTAKVSKKD